MGAEPTSVQSERRDSVLVVRIDNPPLNLLTQEIRRSLGEIFAAAAADDGARAVVLASGPEHFCAGADMKEFPLRFDPEVARAHAANGHRMALNLVRCPKPTIAAIEGACLGGGMELALACDFRIAARTAKLGLPEINRGVWPGTGGIPLLARLIGAARAKELILNGETMDATEAKSANLVEEVVEEGQAIEAALQRAGRLVQRPAAAVRSVKQLADRQFLASFAAHLEDELEAYVACYQTEDAREGNRAFFEKRPPRWTHQ